MAQDDRLFLRELFDDADPEPMSDEEWQEILGQYSLAELVGQIIEADYGGAYSGQTAVSGLDDKTYQRLYQIAEK